MLSALPTSCFLSDVAVCYVGEDGRLIGASGGATQRLAQSAAEHGRAEVWRKDELDDCDASAAIAIPVHRKEQVVCVVLLVAKPLSEDADDVVGVFEVWEPAGEYEELALTSGFYGRMERFENVSSFVRFEKGTGLPGQVWHQQASVIHDDLANHPGFLRAAGASADLLTTAMGIPVASDTFHGSVLLISSSVSPLARGFEVWQAKTNGAFSLLGGAYPGFEDSVALPPEAMLDRDVGLPGLVKASGTAVLSHDPSVLFAGRAVDQGLPDSGCGLAIPCFDDDELATVTTMLF